VKTYDPPLLDTGFDLTGLATVAVEKVNILSRKHLLSEELDGTGLARFRS